MQSVLLDLQKEIRKTVVFITHDLDEALRLGDRIAILRDGEIIQQGSSQDIVLRPADAYIESFVREVNRGRVIRADAAMARLDEAAVPAVSVAGSATLEDAGRLMVESGSTRVAVTDDQTGRAIGLLSMETILKAMTLKSAPVQ